jgi:hypothetical protein
MGHQGLAPKALRKRSRTAQVNVTPVFDQVQICDASHMVSTGFAMLSEDLCQHDSMGQLVENAREVRRLILEASFESFASDVTLCLKPWQSIDSSGGRHHMKRLFNLKDSGDAMAFGLSSSIRMDGHQSVGGLTSNVTKCSRNFAEDYTGSTRLEDLLQPCQRFWRLSNVPEFQSVGLSSSESLSETHCGELAWESPGRRWHDLKEKKYKLALTRWSKESDISLTMAYDPSESWERTSFHSSADEERMMGFQSITDHRQEVFETAEDHQSGDLKTGGLPHKSGTTKPSSVTTVDSKWCLSDHHRSPQPIDSSPEDSFVPIFDHPTQFDFCGPSPNSSDESGYQEADGNEHCEPEKMVPSATKPRGGLTSTPAREVAKKRMKLLIKE